MAIKWNADGSASLRSVRDVRDALRRRDELSVLLDRQEERVARTKAAQDLLALQTEYDELGSAVDGYVIDNYEGGFGYEDEYVKVTKVVGHTRTWNVDVLKEKLSHAMFKKVTKVVVDQAAIDDLVGRSVLTVDQIADAYEERAKKPFVKTTFLDPTSDGGRSESESLAAKLS